ncbi:MAG: pro-sigmaK processing inhibitor BofA family protein [Candidatus Micrarchaeota archaeon]
MAIYIELGALILAAFILYVVYRFLNNPLLLIANSILGFVALVLLNAVFGLGIAINFWSLVVIALGGVGGLVIVVVLHLLGLGF